MAAKFEDALREFIANEVGRRLHNHMQEFQAGVLRQIEQKADRHELQELTRQIDGLEAEHNEGMRGMAAAALASVIVGPLPAEEAPPAPLVPPPAPLVPPPAPLVPPGAPAAGVGLDLGGLGAACAAAPDAVPAASSLPSTTSAKKGSSSSSWSAAEACGFEIVKSGTGSEEDYGDEQEETAKKEEVKEKAKAQEKGEQEEKRKGDEKRKESKREKSEKQEEEQDIAVEAPKIATAPEEPPIAVGLLFPGQGSQYVRMMTGVQDIPKVKEYLAMAKEVLGWDVLELCLQGPESKLEETRYCQPCMFVAGMAGLERLRGERQEAAERFKVTSGPNVGEYTALCAAGVFSFEDGLRLVDVRGRAMQEAQQVGKQAQLSVAGLEERLLEALCSEARRREGASGVCQISTKLFPGGFTCAGSESAILALKDMSEKARALQAKLLKPPCAFHSPLMAPAAEKLGEALDEMLPRMRPPRHWVYMNATATPIKPGTDPKEVVGLLKRQLTSPVLWEPSVTAMIAAGVSEFYEVGPMKQIKAMMKRIDAKVWGTTYNVEI